MQSMLWWPAGQSISWFVGSVQASSGLVYKKLVATAKFYNADLDRMAEKTTVLNFSLQETMKTATINYTSNTYHSWDSDYKAWQSRTRSLSSKTLAIYQIL